MFQMFTGNEILRFMQKYDEQTDGWMQAHMHIEKAFYIILSTAFGCWWEIINEVLNIASDACKVINTAKMKSTHIPLQLLHYFFF